MSYLSRRLTAVRSTPIKFLAIIAFGIGAIASAFPLFAQHDKPLHGEVQDPLGALVVHASVDLLRDARVVASTTTDANGVFEFDVPQAGRYSVRVTAPSFQTTTTKVAYFGSTSRSDLSITLATQTFTQEITVTATGTPIPEAQVGASVTVIPAEDFRYSTEVQDPLRRVPGLQMTQTGQTGGTTGLSIRGGETDANKVVIDGVPANAIGGGVEFADLASVGVDSIEVLRESNSAIYGSDALAGVVSLTSTRGSTVLPLLTYAGDAGNFGTYRNEVTGGTVYRKFDLYSAFARIDTDNNIPNSEFHNATYAGNFGWNPNASNDLRFTVRHIVFSAGQPNAIDLYGIPDSAQQKNQDNYYGVVWNDQLTSKWHSQIRYAGLRQDGQFNTFGPTGIFDPVFGIWDGAPVTISGANGYTVNGQAAFQFSGSPTQYLTFTSRDFIYAQADYQITRHLLALGAFKYEDESGSSGYVGATPEKIQRVNYSYTIQFTGDVHNRLFYNLGTGLEDNGLFGFAAAPRASLAYYLFRPSGAGSFSGTKLHGSFGKGIKEPSVFQQTNSLYGTLLTVQDGSELIQQYNVKPLGPENSRTYDAGLDQQILRGNGRIGLTYFHDEFTNGVQNVPQQSLGDFGVPPGLLPEFPFGAYLNGAAFRTMGLELDVEYKLSNRLFARGGYTYTDAVVQETVAAPSFNTSFNFGTVPIGAYAPLQGARPFRVAPHTGYFGLNYTRSKFYASFTGTIVGRRDDSDYLLDSDFGNSLLLPNRNLLGSYERLELGGGYQITPRINIYTNIQNLLSEHYYEAFGYPSLPLTFRSGIKFNFGGDSGKF
jgi:vitamin B12 transporter